jgi:diadenosine tetraphosphate (Ap4A) HIT family hydrolase
MSCDLTCPLSVGVGADSAANAVQITSSDSLLSESQFTRVWIDAKARPMLIFTPVRHVERLSDMSDDELHDFLICVQTALTKRSLNRFHCAIVNHGDFRNHAHLHLKLRFQQHAFEEASKHWPTEERTKVERIRAFAASVEKDLPQRGPARTRQDE